MLTMLMTVTSITLLPIMSITSWVYPITVLLCTMVGGLKLFQYASMNSLSSFTVMDSMSSSMVLLSVWITMLMLVASTKISGSNMSSSLFMSTSVLLLLVLLLCFTSANLFSFYIWFEASLIPTMYLILLWGYQPERLQASLYLMIYTVMASLPLLVTLSSTLAHSSHLTLYYPWIMFTPALSNFIGSLMLITAFMVKLPLFSVHLWLPKAHVEAPVAGSMILAAILLKLGGYGLMRVCVMFPYQVMTTAKMFTSVSLIGAIVCSLICLRQTDLKSLIAYSSVSHMGIMIAGVMTVTKWGLGGALLMMVAHGLVSSGLFCLANITYEMTHTRSTVLTKGLLFSVPILSMMWFLLISANMAAPPSINLMSEIMLITSIVAKSTFLSLLVGSLSFMTAAYSLYLYSVMNHGGHSSLTNSQQNMSPRQLILIILHFVPVTMLIVLPHLMTFYL